MWTPLLMPLFVLPLARLPADRVSPRLVSWLLAGSAVGLAAGSTLVLGLLAGAGLMHLPFVAAMEHLSPSLVRRSSPVAIPIACVAGPVLAVVVGRAIRTAHRRLVGLARAGRTVSGGSDGLVVLAEESPEAYALPGRPGRVVVTSGMLRALDARERAVLFAHERAHLSGRHHWFIVVADVAAALHPALAALRSPLVYSLERWADEAAARALGDRRLVARAIARAALARARAGDAPSFAPAIALSATAGPVPRRVAALLDETPPGMRSRVMPWIGVALSACLLTSGASALDAATDLNARLESLETHRAPIVVRAARPPAVIHARLGGRADEADLPPSLAER